MYDFKSLPKRLYDCGFSKVKECSLENERFTLTERDVLSIDTLPDVDYVFHQAAQAEGEEKLGLRH